MLSGWIRALGLVAVAALLANAQCYNTCALAACTSAQTPSNDCPQHRHKPSHENSSDCQHQHSEFIGPESGIAKVSIAPAAPFLGVLTVGSAAVLIEPLLLLQPATSSPPGGQVSSAISVLRI
jgi:hypothetical protein